MKYIWDIYSFTVAFMNSFGRVVFFTIVCSIFANKSFALESSSTKGQALNLSIDASSAVLVRVPQLNADYILDFQSDLDSSKNFSIDTDAFIRLDEVAFITSEMCRSCQIIVRPKGEIDALSVFEPRIEKIDLNKFPLASLAFSMYNQIGYKAYQVYHEGAPREAALKQVIACIDNLSATEEEFEWLSPHSLSIKAYLQNNLDDQDGAEKTLKRVKEITSDSIYAVQANYELSAMVEAGKQKKAYFKEGIRIAENMDQPSLVAQGKNYMAIAQIREGQFQDAILNLESAKNTYKSIGSLRNYFDVIGNISWWASESGDLELALKNATEQKLLAEKYNDERSVLWALYDLAVVYYSFGDYYKSLNLLVNVESRLEQSKDRLSDGYRSLLAFVLKEKAHQSIGVGELVGAKRYAQKAKEIVQKLGWQDRIDRMDIIFSEISLLEGNSTSVINTLNDILNRRISEDSDAGVVNLFFLLSEAHVLQGKNNVANVYLKRAEVFLEQKPDVTLQAKLAVNKFRMLVKERNFNEALSKLNSYEDMVDVVEDTGLKIEFSHLTAQVLAASGDKEGALNKLNVVREKIGNQLKSAVNPSLRRAILAQHRKVYETSIRLSLEVASPDKSGPLKMLESFRGRTLFEALNGSLIGAEDEQIELVQERDELLRSLISTATEWYSKERNSSEYLVNQIEKISTRLESLESQIRTDRKEVRDKPIIVSDADFEKLSSDELVLSYFLGEEKAWLWVIASSGIEVFSIDQADEIKQLASRYSAVIATPPALRQGVSPYEQRQLRMRLSELALKQARNYLLSDRYSKITFITDGELSSIPFSALSYNDEGDRLVSRFQVNYAPSLGILAKLQQRVRATPLADARALILASNKGGLLNGLDLPNIPYTLSEAATIGSLIGDKANIVIPPELSKSLVQQELMNGYGVLHMAAHGVYSSVLPGLSGLVVDTGGDTGQLWLAPEISRTDHKLDLVVLSSCQSNQGPFVDGEGLMSLGRSFLESGAKQVVGSLWQVEDQATANLMSAFYMALYQKRMSSMEALRFAQMSIINKTKTNWGDPYYWASFQLLGST